MQVFWHILHDAYLRFCHFVSGQFHHSKVSFAECPDDFIKADLQRPGPGWTGLRARAAVCHNHHDAGAVCATCERV